MFENLSWKSIVRFAKEPALWGGALVAIVVAVRDAIDTGADVQTIVVVAVTALVAFIVRSRVSPV